MSIEKIQTHSRGYKKPHSPAKSKKGRVEASLKIHSELHTLFRQIGTPPSSPFTPDEFQVEALDKLKCSDVLVSAPTGSGKTWIALEAIKGYLNQGKRAWYATPLKALSNSKYEEFKEEFGADTIGILTGDMKENPDAPVVVGTTEILRNQLYDTMHSGSDIRVDLVVLDEAHYLSDLERGVVWEEVLIYLPNRVKLLLLSATLENGPEIAQWLSQIRGTPCSVVDSEKRPVPLAPLFLFPDGRITPLTDQQGLLPQIDKFFENTRRSKGSKGSLTPQYGVIIQHLRTLNLLPAIFFLKSRADCDRALMTCLPAPKPTDDEEKRFNQIVNNFLDQFPFLHHHRQLHCLIENRIGSHHAGQLPHWKLFIEKMMNDGLLEAIFSTSTVAAGVNFPARTVVLVQSDRYNGKEFIDLTATELHQMTGRAGRRGKDNIGFALILPGVFQDPWLINTLLSSQPEPLKSQLQINFSMVLNLLISHRPEEIRELLHRSFATFQLQLTKQMREGEERKISKRVQKIRHKLWFDFRRHVRFLKETGFVTPDDHLTPDGIWAAQLRLDHPLLIAECIRRNVFEDKKPEVLAGLIAPFVCDKTRDVTVDFGKILEVKKFKESFKGMIHQLKPLRKLEIIRGFENPLLQFWPAAALFIWSQGCSWLELMKLIEVEEGDMVMLILRTADNLRQIRNLEKTHPALAHKAAHILHLILREPVLVY